MYCRCSQPKIKQVQILHENITVCAKSIGGCGNEIVMEVKTKKDKCYFCLGMGKLPGNYSLTDCTVCNGTGQLEIPEFLTF